MVILASKSPRRKELCSNLFGDINIKTANVEENYTSVKPSSIVMELSKKKAAPIEGKDDDLIIAADTIVYFRGEVLGKPKDDFDAFRMLSELSNHTHQVYSGVTLKYGKKTLTFYDKSEVTFKKLTKDEILDYIKTGSPKDKAGAYGIQDKWLIKSYKGSYNNILGLPTEKLLLKVKEIKAEV